jgi:plasmid stabilization system protein ParE
MKRSSVGSACDHDPVVVAGRRRPRLDPGLHRTHSAHYAKLVVQRLAAAIDLLALSPQMGRVVPEIGDPEVREVIVGAYRVVYRYRHDAVEIRLGIEGTGPQARP